MWTNKNTNQQILSTCNFVIGFFNFEFKTAITLDDLAACVQQFLLHRVTVHAHLRITWTIIA